MREKWIDNAKGIAILLVILGHVSTDLTGIWNFSFVYGIHLVMFFLLSGYTFKKREITRNYVNQKFSRLMCPYFYTCFTIIITDAINSYYLNRDGSIDTVTYLFSKDLLRSFFASGTHKTFGTIDLGTRIGAIWFLPAMFFAIVIFQLLLKHITDDRYLGMISAGIALAGYLLGRFIWLPFSIQSGMMACFFLWIGYEIKMQRLLDDLKWYHYIIAQLILLFGIYNGYCNIGFVTADISDIFISIPVGLSGSLFIYWISKTMSGRILENIGKMSLTVLCTHLYALETMGMYFNKLLDRIGFGGNIRTWCFIFLEFAFALITAFGIEKLKKVVAPIIENLRKESQKRELSVYKERETAIDVAKGIFIISMLIGYFRINSMLRDIIYSCHMTAFIFFSGYFYKKENNMGKTVRHLLRSFLLPYIIFVAGVVVLNIQSVNMNYIIELVIQYSLGMSFSGKLLSEVPSVGPVYFILMLFIIQLLYLILDHLIKTEQHKLASVIYISVGGMVLGREQLWLPWSIDIACYSLIFYQIGVYFRKYDLLSKIKNNHMVYFILSPVWVYMIYAGSMEIAIRNYGQYGLMILGSVAGILLVYKLSTYISDTLPVTKELLRLTGESFFIVIIIHTLLNDKISHLVSYRFDMEYIPYLIIVVSVQVILSWVIKKVLNRVSPL